MIPKMPLPAVLAVIGMERSRPRAELIHPGQSRFVRVEPHLPIAAIRERFVGEQILGDRLVMVDCGEDRSASNTADRIQQAEVVHWDDFMPSEPAQKTHGERIRPSSIPLK
jgi:hypothetical protein